MHMPSAVVHVWIPGWGALSDLDDRGVLEEGGFVLGMGRAACEGGRGYSVGVEGFEWGLGG